ncbi:MAG: hypothetical protein JWN82_114 [Candidatus Saccharibacteria bacterium]|nr:hypothetical protein [Candidatus Saccharibacteria bacterium]
MRKMLVGATLGLVMVVGGLLMSSGKATAASGCDDYAIMRCGATSASQFINKLNNNPPGDLKAVYADYGLVPSQYGRFASSAKPGVIHDNGNITVDGVVVGRSTQNVGRVHDANFNQKVTINGHDYWGGPFGSTYHADSADVMVMFNDQGVMQFAVVSSCGNPQRITPNKPNYSCNNLQKTKVDGTKNTYRFTTNATASQGAQVVKAVYDFGDGDSKTVTDLSQPVQHTFTKNSTVRVTVYVRVPGGNVVTTTSAPCATEIKFVPPDVPTFAAVCSSLQVTLLDQATRNYKFVATAQYTNNVTFNSADFTFGDNTVMKGLIPNGKQVTVRHAYGKAGTYTVTAKLNFTTPDGKKGSSTCEATITPTTIECKPGVPQGSPECKTQPPKECVAEGKGDNSCELTDTGPGTIIASIFGGVGTVATVGHYLIRRRLLGL